MKCIFSSRSNVKIISTCTLITVYPKILVLEHCHEQPNNQPWRQNVRITLKAKSQGHKVNEVKPFSYKLGCK